MGRTLTIHFPGPAAVDSLLAEAQAALSLANQIIAGLPTSRDGNDAKIAIRYVADKVLVAEQTLQRRGTPSSAQEWILTVILVQSLVFVAVQLANTVGVYNSPVTPAALAPDAGGARNPNNMVITGLRRGDPSTVIRNIAAEHLPNAGGSYGHFEKKPNGVPDFDKFVWETSVEFGDAPLSPAAKAALGAILPHWWFFDGGGNAGRSSSNDGTPDPNSGDGNNGTMQQDPNPDNTSTPDQQQQAQSQQPVPSPPQPLPTNTPPVVVTPSPPIPIPRPVAITDIQPPQQVYIGGFKPLPGGPPSGGGPLPAFVDHGGPPDPWIDGSGGKISKDKGGGGRGGPSQSGENPNTNSGGSGGGGGGGGGTDSNDVYNDEGQTFNVGGNNASSGGPDPGGTNNSGGGSGVGGTAGGTAGGGTGGDGGSPDQGDQPKQKNAGAQSGPDPETSPDDPNKKGSSDPDSPDGGSEAPRFSKGMRFAPHGGNTSGAAPIFPTLTPAYRLMGHSKDTCPASAAEATTGVERIRTTTPTPTRRVAAPARTSTRPSCKPIPMTTRRTCPISVAEAAQTKTTSGRATIRTTCHTDRSGRRIPTLASPRSRKSRYATPSFRGA